MSRIGKVPVAIPAGVTVQVENGNMTVSGKKGKLSRIVPPHVSVSVSGDRAVVSIDSADRANLYGMYRTLLANMVKGVTDGFTKILEIVGVGYKAESKKGLLHLSLGYSHPVLFPLPEGISADVEGNTVIKIGGIDKELVGETAARIRSLRSPDAYKLKGVRYRGEKLVKKAGKAAGK
ncbi:MAG: 50S ribosomal protein L6 [Actinobacteria bacterium]|nr:50S ribosomal protein L6 [Actinomycetota bacterium]MBM2827714.1 ribosomal protein [Actinomycetota bacterium]